MIGAYGREFVRVNSDQPVLDILLVSLIYDGLSAGLTPGKSYGSASGDCSGCEDHLVRNSNHSKVSVAAIHGLAERDLELSLDLSTLHRVLLIQFIDQ
jgi:hypothetical protein